jgi:hypothetical protein
MQEAWCTITKRMGAAASVTIPYEPFNTRHETFPAATVGEKMYDLATVWTSVGNLLMTLFDQVRSQFSVSGTIRRFW